MEFEKQIAAEILLLKQSKAQQKFFLQSALTKKITNANFKEPRGPLTLGHIIGILYKVPLVGPALKKLKKTIYDPWKFYLFKKRNHP